uniref:Zinc finger, CCHC-type n=1 Tax=Tanacetum cinerariifolium TaxID=118510 RepID=A0A6L2LL83_TANCI|nr:zinc finger, CCHC-type [Tanacetum cinerariifolium]
MMGKKFGNSLRVSKTIIDYYLDVGELFGLVIELVKDLGPNEIFLAALRSFHILLMLDSALWFQVDKRVWFEVELQGAQGNREAKVFQVSNNDAAVAQIWLKNKQLEEKTNTDCLVGAGKEGNVAKKKNVKESMEVNLGKVLKYNVDKVVSGSRVQVDKRVWFEVELQGAQGNREAKVFQVSNNDAAVAQRWLKNKQLEEKTNTDCLVGAGKGPNVAPVARECTFADFMKCSPITFSGNEGAVGPDLVELTGGYFGNRSRDQENVGINEGEVTSSEPATLSKAVRMAHTLMEQKVKRKQKEKLIIRRGSERTSKEAVVVVVEITINSMNSPKPTPSSRPTKVEVPKELSKVSIVNTSLKKLKHHLVSFDVVIKERTTTTATTEGTWGDNSFSQQSVPSFDQLFEIKKLNAQSQEKDMVIKKLKERVKSLSGNMKEEIETINIELDHRVTKLIAENDHLKQTYKQLYDSIKSSPLKDNIRKLKGMSLLDDVVTSHPIDPKLLKVDVAQLAPKLQNNRTAHSDYLKHTQKETVTLREIVKQGRSLNPLNTYLIYVASESQPSGNTKKDKIQKTPSSTKKNKIEDHPRTIRFSLRNKNCVVKSKDTASMHHSKLNVNSDLQCVSCNGCLFFDNHDSCVLDFINNVNARVKSKSVKKTVKRKVWKPTGKVVQIVLWDLNSGCSNHMIEDHSQLTNFINKFLGMVKFSNDHVAKIMGYGDYQIGNVI